MEAFDALDQDRIRYGKLLLKVMGMGFPIFGQVDKTIALVETDTPLPNFRLKDMNPATLALRLL